MIPSLFQPMTSPGMATLVAVALTLLKMTCVLVIALAVTLAMRRESAGARHLVWLVAFTALLALPALSAWAPVPIRMLPEVAVRSATTVLEPVASPPTPSLPPVANTAPRIGGGESMTSRTPVGAIPARRSIGLGSLLVLLWSVGVVALLGRFAVGAWWIRRTVRRARVLDGADWQRPLVDLSDRLGMADVPQLLLSDRVQIPFTSGLLRSHIVLPADSEQWSPARRSAVLMHELAHVRRRDLLGHTASRIVCALYWFHPLVWTAARRLRAESERACDDLALELGARPSEYAEHLLDIVSHVRAHGIPAAALAMANPNEFEGRMLAILNPRIRRRGLGRVQTAWLVGSLAVLALVVGAVTPAPRAAVGRTVSATVPSESTSQVTKADRASETAKPVEQVDRAAVPESSEDAKDTSAQQGDEDSSDHDAKHTSDSKEAEADAAHRVAILAKTLRADTSPEVRRVAAWGLANYADESLASDVLAAALAGDDDEDVREMAAWALAESQGQGNAASALQKAFHDKSKAVRQTAAWAAGSIGDRSAVPGLVALLADSDPDLREVTAWSIGSCTPERAPPALVRLLSDPSPHVRLSVAWALREIGDAEAADELEAAFRREKDSDVQEGLIRALGAMGDRAIGTLSRLVDSNDPEIRSVVVTALAGGNTGGAWPWPRPEPRPFP